jgi:hypothetical protein
VIPRLLRSCAIAAVFVVATAACSGDDDPAASPGETLPTTTTIGVHEVPDEITVDYVQQVMDEIDASWGGMFRQLKLDGEMTDSTRSWIQSLHGEAAPDMEAEMRDVVEHDFDIAVPSPGDPRTIVDEVVVAADDCIVFSGRRSYADVYVDPGDESATLHMALRERTGGDERKNLTAWVFTDERPVDDAEDLSCG